MTSYRATAYQTNEYNDNIRVLCYCTHVTRRFVLRQLVFNLVAIGFLRDSQSCYDNVNGSNFAHKLTQDVKSAEDVDTICMTYGKPGFNVPGGWSWHLYCD